MQIVLLPEVTSALENLESIKPKLTVARSRNDTDHREYRSSFDNICMHLFSVFCTKCKSVNTVVSDFQCDRVSRANAICLFVHIHTQHMHAHTSI